MTFLVLEFDGDCHTSDVGHWFAMTGSDGPLNSDLPLGFADPVIYNSIAQFSPAVKRGLVRERKK